MNNKKHLALVLAALVVGFCSMAGSTPAIDCATARVVKPRLELGRHLPIIVPKEGPGPMCPLSGCGYR